MNGLQRTLDFIDGKAVDLPPFHPILMRFAAKYAGVAYRDFCLRPECKTAAMIACARDFGLDWVTVLSDPYSEAEAFGLEVEYPEDSLPQNTTPLIREIGDIDRLELPKFEASRRMLNRVREIELYRQSVGSEFFIVGWVEGALAEYVDLRGLTQTCMDLYDAPEPLERALRLLNENAKAFITRQVEAGAHCIGIGDAACSQIGPKFYRNYVWELEKELVEHIQALGCLAKVHICGNTSSFLADVIRTGADIVDVDHLSGDMLPFVEHLQPGQVLCGNSDPVSVVQDGTDAELVASVEACHLQTQGRGIVSAGCEITPGTSVERFQAYATAARALG
ncbi:MAG: uroporphyrinogen decarboxylase family protein [Verrucomicrobiota bacterium]|jgi:MtaA/CmuA family methyltransferase|nr:uroporphyrinogen decarboxylase family protein [Verrucomicrobiota bacterium]